MKQFLQSLRTDDPNNWTTDGLPRVEVVQKRFGIGATREVINAALPGLTRESAAQRVVAPAVDSPPVLGDTVRHLTTALDALDVKMDRLQQEHDKLRLRRDVLLLEQATVVGEDPIIASARHALSERLARTPEQRAKAVERRRRQRHGL